MKLDQFTEGYLQCALFTETDDNEDPLDTNYCISDFSDDAIEKAKADCDKFLNENIDNVSEIAEHLFEGIM